MISSLRLPFQFDTAALKSDLARVADPEFIPHFNRSYYQGEWSAAPLRSVDGKSGDIYPDPSARHFEPTDILRRCPYFQQVLATLECPLLAARLLRLKAGSRIREHTDLELSFEEGEIRVHVPVQTSPEVEFYLDGRRIALGEGECWYVNTTLRHRVTNKGAADRIHLVVDCVVNDWVRGVFAA